MTGRVSTSREANTTSSQPPRYRCPVCSQYPTLRGGRLAHHNYPWYHSQHGQPCPGSSTQITPLEGQLSIDRRVYLCQECGKPIIVYLDQRWQDAPDDKTPMITTELGNYHQDCYAGQSDHEEYHP